MLWRRSEDALEMLWGCFQAGMLWGCFLMIWECCWDDLGMNLGCFGDDFCVVLECFWNDFGIPFYPPGPSNIIF